MISVTMYITAGLPYKREYVVTLPAGRTWWTDDSEFEILSQIREEKNRTSRLIKDLAEHMTVAMPSANEVRVTLEMAGINTRDIDKSGYYDVLMSDPGVTDGRAIIISKGPVKLTPIITAELEGGL